MVKYLVKRKHLEIVKVKLTVKLMGSLKEISRLMVIDLVRLMVKRSD